MKILSNVMIDAVEATRVKWEASDIFERGRCVTLRDSTERPVTVSHGTNRLIGSNPLRIAREVLEILAGPPRLNGPPLLWDEKAAARIENVLTATQVA